MAIFDSDEILISSLVTCGLQQLQLPSCLKGKPPINPVAIHQQTTLSPTPPSSSQLECGQNPYKHFLIVFAVLLIIKPNREVSKKEDDVNLILTKVSMIINTKVIIIITKMLMLIMITILIISHPTGKLLTHYRTKQRTLPPVAIHCSRSPENISSKSWLPNSSPKFPHKSLHQPS